MPLYHKDIGFPKNMKFRAIDGLTPSMHALRESTSDRYGGFTLPTSFNPTDWTVIEIETINGALNKIVARKAYDAARDIVMAFLPQTKLIKTAWINVRSDLHNTLDKRAYDVP